MPITHEANGNLSASVASFEAWDSILKAGQVSIDPVGKKIGDGTTKWSDLPYVASDVRKSKLDNPLTWLFKKNNLVDTLQGALSWTRDSGATYVDRYGVVQYSPSPNATNVVRWSETFSDPSWAKTNCTITDNALPAPNGTMTADILDVTTGGQQAMLQSTPITSANTIVTSSFWIKKLSGDGDIALRAGEIASGPLLNLTSEWQRYDYTGLEIDGNSTRISIVMNNPTSDLQLAVWGAQLETSKVANGYVRTESAGVTGTSYFGIEQAREESEGWLVEGASTNIATYSQQFDNGVWNKSNGSVITPDDTTAPDGTNTADKLDFSTNPNSLILQTIAVTDSGQDFTLSFFVKNINATSIALRPAMTGGTTLDQFATYEFSTGIWSGALASTGRATALNDGWLKLSVTITGNGTNTAIQCRMNNVGSLAQSVYIWGAQLEELPFASSYIPTEASAVTRAREQVFCAWDNNINVNADNSISMKFTAPAGVQNFAKIFSSDVVNDYHLQYGDSFNMFYKRGPTGTNTFANNRLTGLNYAVITQLGDQFTSYINGDLTRQQALSDTSDLSFNQLVFMNRADIDQAVYGHILDFRTYDFALTPEEVTYLAGE